MSFFMERAEASLRSARMLASTDDTSGTISRAYYDCFYAAQAVLEPAVHRDKGRIKTHAGLIRLFSLEVVKTGKMPAAVGAILGRAQDLRVVADYGETFPSQAAAEELVGAADTFVVACRALLEEEKRK